MTTLITAAKETILYTAFHLCDIFDIEPAKLCSRRQRSAKRQEG